jgi:hypothetical protein
MKFFVFLISAVCVSMLIATAACADPRPITVTITASDPDGNPIQDMPLQCLTNVGAAFGITDVNGQLVLVLSAQQDEQQLITQLWDGAMYNNLTISERLLAERRDNELRNMYSFKPVYLTSLNIGNDQYSVAIQTGPTVRISGRLVSSTGAPQVGGIGSVHYIAYDDVGEDDDGVFDFGGILKGVGTLLLAQYSTQVHIIEIAGTQVLDDLDLGDVMLVDSPADAPIRITMQNRADLFDSTGVGIALGMSFISTDGSLVIGFPADLEGNVLRELFYVPPPLPLLPPGEYYAVPGLISTQSGMALYLSIREGRQALLDAAGVPKFTAVSGQEVSLTIDARAAYEAVVQVGGDLVPE